MVLIEYLSSLSHDGEACNVTDFDALNVSAAGDHHHHHGDHYEHREEEDLQNTFWYGVTLSIVADAFIAVALCTDEEGNELEDEGALALCRALDSKEQLLERIRSNNCLERLTDAIWPKLEVLKAGPATASELAAQWKAEGAGGLLGDLAAQAGDGLLLRLASGDAGRDVRAVRCVRWCRSLGAWNAVALPRGVCCRLLPSRK